MISSLKAMVHLAWISWKVWIFCILPNWVMLFMCELCRMLCKEIVRGWHLIYISKMVMVHVWIMCDLRVMLSLEIDEGLDLYGYFHNGLCGIYVWVMCNLCKTLNWITWNGITWLTLLKLMANSVCIMCSFSHSFNWPKEFQFLSRRTNYHAVK